MCHESRDVIGRAWEMMNAFEDCGVSDKAFAMLLDVDGAEVVLVHDPESGMGVLLPVSVYREMRGE